MDANEDVLELFLIVDEDNDGGEEYVTIEYDPTIPNIEKYAQTAFDGMVDLVDYLFGKGYFKVELTLQRNKGNGEDVTIIDEYILIDH